jgi:hypothetical protein
MFFKSLVHGHANPVNLIDQRFDTPTKSLPLIYRLCEPGFGSIVLVHVFGLLVPLVNIDIRYAYLETTQIELFFGSEYLKLNSLVFC